jgi:hypothetical protein
MALLAGSYRENEPEAHLSRWFCGGAALGLAAAIAVEICISHNFVSTELAFALWPAGIIQLIDPETFGLMVMTAALAYGGNMLFYGLTGLTIGFAIQRIRAFSTGTLV